MEIINEWASCVVIYLIFGVLLSAYFEYITMKYVGDTSWSIRRRIWAILTWPINLGAFIIGVVQAIIDHIKDDN